MSGMRLAALFVLGTLAFLAISFLEQVPVIGWLGAIVSFAAWAILARAAAREGGFAPLTAAVLGGWTGFVGAWSAWAFQTGNLFGLDTAPLARAGAGFGFIGATLGLVYWPLIGAGIAWLVALFPPDRRVA